MNHRVPAGVELAEAHARDTAVVTKTRSIGVGDGHVGVLEHQLAAATLAVDLHVGRQDPAEPHGVVAQRVAGEQGAPHRRPGEAHRC
jgi:hypothetical protein